MKDNTHFIAQYIVDLRNQDDPEIINNDLCMTLTGGLDNECYFQECASQAEVDNIIDSAFDTQGKRTYNLEPGVYRITVGGICNGSVSDTPWGREYDSWEDYETLNVYKYTEEEMPYVLEQEDE